VEIVGLSYAAVAGLAELHERGLYPYGAVERATTDGKLVKWSLQTWADTIKQNFESHYWIEK
jgi:hypothetical protein